MRRQPGTDARHAVDDVADDTGPGAGADDTRPSAGTDLVDDVDPAGPDRDLEAAVVAAFATGAQVDARGGRVEADVLARLLLSDPDAAGGRVPAVRLRDAVVTGRLDLSFAEVAFPVHLERCVLAEAPRLTGASTRSLELVGCTLPGVEARLVCVRGDLRLTASRVEGPTNLENAEITGTLQLSGARLIRPGGRALSAGGMVVGGGVLGRHGLTVEGEARLIGARIDGGVLLEGASFSHPDGTALCLDEVVTNRIVLSGGFRTDGELRLRGAQVSGEVSLFDARLRARDRALRARGMTAGELVLVPAEVTGLVDLSRVHVGALRDRATSWPAELRLDGFTYEHLLPVGPPVDVVGRCGWLRRDAERYRPQPYEQLAAYYRRLGHDDDARRVLLAKERRRRATLGPVARTAGYVLDGLVGYGYRSWLAAVWLSVLVAGGTAVFGAVPPAPIDPQHRPHFTALIYTVDLLIPIGAFGLRTTYDPVGWTRWVADALIAAGWILATALVAGVSRRVGRD